MPNGRRANLRANARKRLASLFKNCTMKRMDRQEFIDEMLRRKWPEDFIMPTMILYDALAKNDHGGDYEPLLKGEYRPPQHSHPILGIDFR
ncbi:Uncharacterised protein [Slackia heliotrinireducens]|nr:Uncharacterised protein [Slackia heliotrinireducens]